MDPANSIMASSSNDLLDYIADCHIFLSRAPSFWFSPNSSYDHGCHLSHRFGLTPQAYESLLLAANLAHYTKWGFTIKLEKWNFLGGHWLATSKLEMETKRMDINSLISGAAPSRERARICFINIGVKSNKSPATILRQKDTDDGRMITTPPRLNELALKQQSFRRLVQPVIWNYIVEYQEEDGVQPPINSKEHQQTLLPPSSLGSLPHPHPHSHPQWLQRQQWWWAILM